MELIRRLESVNSRDCVVTIGSFDGLHLGHWALVERLRAHAARLALPAMMVTFEPLPREFLQAANPPARLTNFRERWRLLSSSGIERLCVLGFGDRLRALSGLQFMELLRTARTRLVVVGHDFRFGRGGEASAAWCAQHAAQFGFSVDLVAPVPIDGERVSSGRVRTALQGVFAVRVNGAGLPGRPAVASLGTRPMVHGTQMLLEAHLFDFDGDLYGQELEVEFVAHLRDELTFASMDAMVKQMGCDAADARRVLRA